MESSRFNQEDIYYRVLDSQLMFQSGYVSGRKDMKRDIVMKIYENARSAELSADPKHSMYLEMIKMIENNF